VTDAPALSQTQDAAEARRRMIADRVRALPIVEHALDLYAHGGPDMRGEAEAIEALLLDFAERMLRK